MPRRIVSPQENADAAADHERECAAFPRRERKEGPVEASDEGVWAVTVNPHAVTAPEFSRMGVRGRSGIWELNHEV